MTSFMHKLAESLRTREQYLEDHSSHPVFDAEKVSHFKSDYDELVTKVKEFSSRLDKLAASGEDYDEHFERKISDEHERLSVKIDAWAKKIEKE